MSNLTLADLRVVKYEKTQSPFHDAEGFRPAVVYTRPMTLQDLAAILASLTDEELAELGGAVTILDSASVEGELVEVTMYLDRAVGWEMFRKGGNVLVVPIPEDS